MRFILDTVIESLEKKLTVVLVTIVRSSGSAPRTSGARMLVHQDGSIVGTVGGGMLEGKCIDRARKLYDESAEHAGIDFSLTGADVASEGMVCGGAVSVLLQKVNSDALETFLQLRQDFREGLRPLLLTVLPAGEDPPQIMLCDKQATGSLGKEFVDRVNSKKGRSTYLAMAGELEVFVEPLISPGVVHLLGAGHVAMATAQLAKFVDFEVVVMDDREEFANRERYPDAKEVRVIDSFDECLGPLSANDYLIIVTRGHLHDQEVLAQGLRTNAGYIGMIGSKKKRDFVYQYLKKEGFTESDLKRVYSPIGQSIGADTPAEIAMSIVSELVKVRSELGC